MDDLSRQKHLAFRTQNDLKIKPNNYLKPTFTGFDGKEYPLVLRNYQVQMILQLALTKRFVVGDDCGLGKTLEVIAALTTLWSQNPNNKVIVLTTKSATEQWVSEFFKFTQGIQAYAYVGTPNKRLKIWETFTSSEGPTALVMGYRTAVRDYGQMQEFKGFTLILDEASNFKTPNSQIHKMTYHLALQADRVYGLTATLIKNHLMEAYGIFRVIVPDLFPSSALKYMHEYCIVEMLSIPRSPRKIPRIVGYRQEKIADFRKVIEPYYLGRAKHEVASELPSLTFTTREVDMYPHEWDKYVEALSGVLEVGNNSGETEEKEVTKLTAVVYCQEIVDHLGLIDCEGESSKLEALVEMLTEGDLEGEKVIIFSRFKCMVNIIMDELKKHKIKAVRVTGDEDTKQREEAKKAFQNPDDLTRVICITMAGGDAINLQTASAIVFYDSPWSAGDYLQILGRMVRIGSVNTKCLAMHLIAKGRKKTIDHRVLEVLNKKMDLVEAVLGKRVLEEGSLLTNGGNEIDEIFAGLRDDAKNSNPLLKGSKKPKSVTKATTPKVIIEEDTQDIDAILASLL